MQARSKYPNNSFITKYFIVFAIYFYSSFCQAQNSQADSMQLDRITQLHKIKSPNLDSVEQMLSTKANDTSKANLLARLSFHFAFTQADKGVQYGLDGIQLSQQLGYKEGIAYSSQSLAMALWGVGNYSNALQAGLRALHDYTELKDQKNIGFTYYILANIYRDFGDYDRALVEVKKGFQVFKTLGSMDIIGYALTGSIYELKNQIDSASFYVNTAASLDNKLNQGQWGWIQHLQGNLHRKRKQYDSAMYSYRSALQFVTNKDIVETFNGIALLYLETGAVDSTIFYAREVLEKWKFVSYQRGILHATNILADAYKRKNQRDSAIKYLEQSVALNDSLFNQKNEREIQTITFTEQSKLEEMSREQERNRSRIITFVLITAGISLLIFAIFLWRNNNQKQKAKEKIEAAYAALKSTQQQLIQSEKMASLGELTAGIAHEIQNPLNFVNNFSEVNIELLDELELEMNKGNIRVAEDLTKDLKENEQKINHHGKRADAIVKGMLQHSRSSTGIKEPTNINVLADEYLRLAYHGLRAKDKSFNASLKTDFDQAIGTVNVIPQDIGRVILNLITNAFYAVDEKRKQQTENYEPTVSVSTKKIGDKILIAVQDNGNGIPEKVLDKIFQPFFTTKPSGQGTGLGLSLSYDIIKAHGGELKVGTKQNGAEFIIHLPLS